MYVLSAVPSRCNGMLIEEVRAAMYLPGRYPALTGLRAVVSPIPRVAPMTSAVPPDPLI